MIPRHMGLLVDDGTEDTLCLTPDNMQVDLAVGREANASGAVGSPGSVGLRRGHTTPGGEGKLACAKPSPARVLARCAD
jgi:hypothetical protein